MSRRTIGRAGPGFFGGVGAVLALFFGAVILFAASPPTTTPPTTTPPTGTPPMNCPTSGTTTGGTTTGGTTSGGTTSGGTTSGGTTSGGTTSGSQGTTSGGDSDDPWSNTSAVNGPSLAFMMFTLDHMLTGDPVIDYMIAKAVFGDIVDLKVMKALATASQPAPAPKTGTVAAPRKAVGPGR
jgi:hypothetical protein